MSIKVEVIPPKPVEDEVVITLSKRKARELMYVLMNELVWDQISYGETTIADIYRALEHAGIREA